MRVPLSASPVVERNEMSKSLTLLSAALLLNMFSPAHAASSTDLTVRGLITPSACAPALSGGGVIDFGKLSASDLKPDNPTSLPEHSFQMTVSCDAPTLFGLCLLYTSPSPRDRQKSRMPSSA